MLFTEDEIKATNSATLKKVTAQIHLVLSECTEKQNEKFHATFKGELKLEHLDDALSLVNSFIEYNKRNRSHGKN